MQNLDNTYQIRTVWFPNEHVWITTKKDAQGRLIFIRWVTKPNKSMLRKAIKRHFKHHRNRTIYSEDDASFMKHFDKRVKRKGKT